MTRENMVVFAGACALGAAALWPGPVVRRYELAADRLRPGTRLRFAVASDLHSRRFGRCQGKLLELIRREEPDCILLPGDIIDERLDPGPALDFFRGAARIAPCFYSPGNHEYRTGRIKAVCRSVGRLGVTVLVDGLTRLTTPAGTLIIAGCEDPERTRYTGPAYRPMEAARAAFRGVAGEAGFRVLLVHRPELAEKYRRFGFDLMVAGHAHGGQVRLPRLMNGLYAPGQGFLPKLAGGTYNLGDSALLVSRGLGGYPSIPRVFNPPELVILDVISASSNLYQFRTGCKGQFT